MMDDEIRDILVSIRDEIRALRKAMTGESSEPQMAAPAQRAATPVPVLDESDDALSGILDTFRAPEPEPKASAKPDDKFDLSTDQLEEIFVTKKG